ncbi:hypothetical protein [Alloyangia pacifica]|uniref:Uncharacterized protein n=1 Tax=Alloyangia pacifica TaxID=311180 RepID=A0A1I6W2T9_9RHOB|nr:hypothetical protein [Alloyangia pacifica]SDI40027.1 hypothetical protein SAMN04488245_11598 [Alloyangia pacifica]SFT20293.1 hypothetical protein SAMN04488050_11499 [Alloyangia pacifica]
MAYRDTGLPNGGSYGPTLRSEPQMDLAEGRLAGGAGTLTGGLLMAVLVFLGFVVGIGTLRVGGVGESPATSGSGAHGSVTGQSGGTETAVPRPAPVN